MWCAVRGPKNSSIPWLVRAKHNSASAASSPGGSADLTRPIVDGAAQEHSVQNPKEFVSAEWRPFCCGPYHGDDGVLEPTCGKDSKAVFQTVFRCDGITAMLPFFVLKMLYSISSVLNLMINKVIERCTVPPTAVVRKYTGVTPNYRRNYASHLLDAGAAVAAKKPAAAAALSSATATNASAFSQHFSSVDRDG